MLNALKIGSNSLKHALSVALLKIQKNGESIVSPKWPLQNQ
jgi:hypothetical protein